MWNDIAILAVAGAVGTLSRCGISGIVQRSCGSEFPWGTAAVNLIGCFLFGLIWTMTEGKASFGNQTRLIALTGFMGAFTTFSTFAFETSRYLQNSQWMLATGNVFGQVIFGLFLMFLGFAVGRQF